MDHALSRQQLLEKVWGNERYVADRSVDTLISKVRTKLGPYGQCLLSVYGSGYKFKKPVELSGNTPDAKKVS